ncbi:aspartate:alanine exchanger family transporter [Longirhabdus pacifica]|uniref:aspartate:alanine exchanger family transporter n=1 Tax=Longirhabdus pacifica TaxID=2305227 RepID=UPI001F0C90FC|nr:aspartate:alanine exchanger family transporter [Longirhabdus pacifica]
MIISLLDNPLVLLFVILLAGSIVGQFKIKGIGLGSSGILLVAMIAGHFHYQIPSLVQQLGLSLFIVAVGLQAGPRFFLMMRTKGMLFGIIGLLIVLIGAVTTVVVSKLFYLPPALSLGLMTGAMTSTPGLAAAIEATNDPLASVGYGIAYPFGVLAVVFFVQLLPKVFKINLQEDLHRTSGPIRNETSPEVMTIEVTDPALEKRTLQELKLDPYHSVVISRVIRGNRNIIALGDTVIVTGDRLVAVGLRSDLDKLAADIGREVPTNFKNADHVKLRRVTVLSEEMVGKNLRELDLRKTYGVTVTRLEHGGIEYNQSPKWRFERGDVLTMVSSEDRLNEVEKLFQRKHHSVVNVHLLSLSFILLIGVLIGMIPIVLPGLGTIKLGVAGGPLFAALIISHFGKLGPIQARYYQPSNQVIRDIGLALFLAGAGTTAGEGLVEVVRQEGLRLIVGGSIITMTPIVVGYYMSRFVFRLSVIHSLGALCGGMTSTPGLGALNQLSSSEEGSITYAAAYPFALIFVAIASQLLIFFL